ncbi:phasin family protein [Paraburkholderia sp. MM5477-R1]|uniref:phasin family protein n=1 Tax=Paraburkholderia sp. MM5477-R1 TaxID=2991062 RepID=UPI003D2617AC
MESITSNSFFSQYAKVIDLLKPPHVDLAAILESRRKDIEALTAANMKALGCFQSLGEKQAAILSTTTTGLQSLMARSTATQSKPVADTHELVPPALRLTLTNFLEMADTLYKAHSDSLAIVSRRVAENVEEMKALLQVKK